MSGKYPEWAVEEEDRILTVSRPRKRLCINFGLIAVQLCGLEIYYLDTKNVLF